MSIELLEQLQAAHAFDSTPRRADLGAYHVPFTKLGSPRDLEQTLLNATRRSERIAIIGRSGCGKSSLLAHVLGPLAEGVAPILVKVAAEPADVVTSVQAMAAHITQTLVDQAALVLPEPDREQALADTAPQRALAQGRRNRLSSFSLGWMGATIAAQIGQQQDPTPRHQRTAAATLEVLEQTMRLISDQGRLVPVLVFDDTDRWLRHADTTPSTDELAEPFFTRVIPELRELSCGLVVAVHDSYLQDRAVATAIATSLATTIEIPRLPDADALSHVLHSRIEAHIGPQITIDDIFSIDAVDTLFNTYQEQPHGELRAAIRVAHIALTEACDNQLDQITAQLITTATVT